MTTPVDPQAALRDKKFEEFIERTFKQIDCFTENTLDRDEHGSYLNMSAALERPIWLAGWRDGLAAAQPTPEQLAEAARQIESSLIKLNNYALSHSGVIDASWVAKVLEEIRAILRGVFQI